MTSSLHRGGAIPRFEIRHRVRLAREYAGLQQAELAELTGMARSGIAAIEAGKNRPRRSSINLIALATGVSREWLETGNTPAGDGPGGGSECAIRDLNPEPTDLCSLSSLPAILTAA